MHTEGKVGYSRYAVTHNWPFFCTTITTTHEMTTMLLSAAATTVLVSTAPPTHPEAAKTMTMAMKTTTHMQSVLRQLLGKHCQMRSCCASSSSSQTRLLGDLTGHLGGYGCRDAPAVHFIWYLFAIARSSGKKQQWRFCQLVSQWCKW